MPLVVEDGSVVASADSYVTLAEADTYWENRNSSTWSLATDESKEAVLREACLYLDGAYRWIGERVDSTQERCWPRVVDEAADGQAVSSTSVPSAVKKAQMELALAALSESLAAPRGAKDSVASEQVGSLSVSYFQSGPKNKQFPMVDLLVADYVTTKTLGGLSQSALLS